MTEMKRYLPMSIRSVGCLGSPLYRKSGERRHNMARRSIGKQSPPKEYLGGCRKRVDKAMSYAETKLKNELTRFILTARQKGFIKPKANHCGGLGVYSCSAYGNKPSKWTRTAPVPPPTS